MLVDGLYVPVCGVASVLGAGVAVQAARTTATIENTGRWRIGSSLGESVRTAYVGLTSVPYYYIGDAGCRNVRRPKGELCWAPNGGRQPALPGSSVEVFKENKR